MFWFIYFVGNLGWNKDPQLTDRDYLNDINNAGYNYRIKTLYAEQTDLIGQIRKGSTDQMFGFRIF